MDIHVGERQFMCDAPLCGRWFETQSDLTAHSGAAWHSEAGANRNARVRGVGQVLYDSDIVGGCESVPYSNGARTPLFLRVGAGIFLLEIDETQRAHSQTSVIKLADSQ